MKKIQLSILGIVLAVAAFGQDMARGIVFEDKNKNGIIDKGERTLSQVAVSNGKEVVLTNENGRYELPLGKDNIIFVIKPASYALPLNEYNMPAGHYIHKPEGAPSSFKYKGVPATGVLPSYVDFGLMPVKDEKEFIAFIFGDPQPYNLEEIAYFEKGIIDEAKKEKGIAFGISMGDLVGDNLDLHIPYKEAVKKMALPWYNVIGNHDMNYDATDDSLSDETFEKNFGPANYSFNYGKAHFIILDDILYPDPRDGKGYWGGFRPDQLAFIKNDLKYVDTDALVILCMHIPLQEAGNGEFIAQDRQQLFDLLKGYKNVLAISAHTHLQRHNFFTKTDGWKNINPLHEYNVGTTSGDWYSGEINTQGVPASTMRDGTPKGYAYLKIKGNRYTINYKVAGKPADYQIALYHPKILAQNKRTSAQVYANFFMGADTDEVLYRVDKGDWKPMNKIEKEDPAYISTLVKFDESTVLLNGRRPSAPEMCTHLWAGRIPVDLPTGRHTIEVKATDMFGQEFHQSGSYTIQ